jgi:hypothetical protein
MSFEKELQERLDAYSIASEDAAKEYEDSDNADDLKALQAAIEREQKAARKLFEFASDNIDDVEKLLREKFLG